MGSCRVRLNKLNKKETDKWWKLKNTESGKIHLNLNFLEPVEEPNPGNRDLIEIFKWHLFFRLES